MTKTQTLLKAIDSKIARTLATSAGAAVEVTTQRSNARGFFVSLFGTPAACDAARVVMDQVPGYCFTDRDVDPEDPEDPNVVDFYGFVP